MLSVRLSVSSAGLLRRFEAQGHAGADLGKNIACAAATALLRTAERACRERGFVAQRLAAHPGQMSMVLGDLPESRTGWLRGVTDFLLRGMSDLQTEFPDQIVLRVETED